MVSIYGITRGKGMVRRQEGHPAHRSTQKAHSRPSRESPLIGNGFDHEAISTTKVTQSMEEQTVRAEERET